MTPGDLYITKPDHNQNDGDGFKPNQIIIYLVTTGRYIYFHEKDNPNNKWWLSEGNFIEYKDPYNLELKNRFNLIFD